MNDTLTVTAREARGQFGRLLDSVLAGKTVRITRNGRLIAILTQPGQTQVAGDWPTWVAEKYRDIDLTGLRDWDGDPVDGGRDDGVAAEGERLRRQLHRDGESTPES